MDISWCQWRLVLLYANVQGRVKTEASATGEEGKDMISKGFPAEQGLYDPKNEHDACGVGFIVDIKNRATHKIVQQGLEILANLTHRGAVGADPLAGDGAGLLMQLM